MVGSAVIIAKQDELEARQLICSAWQPGNQARAGPSRQESQGCNQMDSMQVTGRGHCQAISSKRDIFLQVDEDDIVNNFINFRKRRIEKKKIRQFPCTIVGV